MSAQASTTYLFTNTPICGPSRATLLTGQYAHHWHTTAVFSCIHMDIQNGSSLWKEQLPVYMQQIGYTTGAFGKTLSLAARVAGDDTNQPIPGFDSSFILSSELTYYQNRFNLRLHDFHYWKQICGIP